MEKAGNFIELIKNNYQLLTIIFLVGYSITLTTYRLDGLDKTMANHEERIKALEIKAEKQNLLLERIDVSLNRMETKFEKYDESIKKFYQEYELKRK